MNRFGGRALRWSYYSKDIEKIVTDLENYEQAFSLSLQVDQIYISTFGAYLKRLLIDLIWTLSWIWIKKLIWPNCRLLKEPLLTLI